MFFLKSIRIRVRITLLFLLSTGVITLISGLILYNNIRSILLGEIERNLKRRSEDITHLIQSNLNTSIKNYLRAVAVHAKQATRRLIGHYPTAVARNKAIILLLQQKIGRSGYIYCINSRGRIVFHPKKALIGRDLSNFNFIRKQIKNRAGYLRYKWKNPGESAPQDKVLYMTYLKEWDWIISVSAYIKDLFFLLDKEDFRSIVQSSTLGKGGYSTILDMKGNIIIHPMIQGGNVSKRKDASGHLFVQEMLRRRNGRIIYDWKNPGEKGMRKKIAYFNTIDSIGWLIASTGYVEEFFTPLNKLSTIILMSFLISVTIAFAISLLISNHITTPIRELIDRFKRGSRGETGLRMPISSRDEFGQLAWYFNLFMEKDESFKKLKKVADHDKLTDLYNRRKTQELLTLEHTRYSRYRRVFSIIFCDIDHFKKVNDTYGHECGDLVLKQTASIFTKELRIQDTAGRWGGEEFVLLLPETDGNGAMITAERIRSSIEEAKIHYRDTTVSITATLGIATIRDNMELVDLIRRADEALYKGKNEGRNRCILDS